MREFKVSMLLSVFSVCLLVLAGSASGDGFRNPPAGAAGLGRAGVGIAYTEGASALFYNPANMLFLNDPQVEAGLVLARLETEFSSPRGSETSEAEWQTLPNLYAVYPLSENNSLGLSVTFPYGQSVEWDRNGIFKYMAPYYAEMIMVDVGPAMAWRLGDKLLIGAGLDIYSSSLEIKQIYNWSNILPGAPDGNARLEGDGTAVGANVGITYLLNEKQRLAFRYRSPFDMEYEGSGRVSNIPAPLSPVFERSSDFRTELHFPEQFALAYGVEIGERLRVEFDVERLRWSRMDEQTLDLGLQNSALLGPMGNMAYDWCDTWTCGVGGDYALTDNWVARAGYQFIETPVTEHAFNPSLPDGDRHVVGLGVGYHNGGHSIDLAWDISFIDEREISGNNNPAFDGKYEMDADLCAISYSYSF